jgi:hypothetical protein
LEFVMPALFVVGAFGIETLLGQGRQKLLCLAGVLFWCCFSFSLVTIPKLAHFILVEIALMRSLRLIEVGFGRVPDNEVLQSFSLRQKYLSVHGDLYLPRSDKEASENKKAGKHFIKEGFLYGVAVIVAFIVVVSIPDWELNLWCRSTCLMLLFALFASSITATLNGATMLSSGVRVSRAMKHPFRASSLADFWSRRWNLTFRDYFHRNLFLPLREYGLSATGAAFAVFVASALVHEYIVLAVLGWSNGTMTAFFMSQPLLIMTGKKLFGKNPNLQALWTWVSLVVTSPLFFSQARFFIPWPALHS